MAKKIVRLTEADLTRLIRKVLKEQQTPNPIENIKKCFVMWLLIKNNLSRSYILLRFYICSFHIVELLLLYRVK